MNESNKINVISPWSNKTILPDFCLEFIKRKFTRSEAIFNSMLCGACSFFAYNVYKINYARLKNSISVLSFIKQRPEFGTGLIAAYIFTDITVSSAENVIKYMKDEEIMYSRRKDIKDIEF